MVEITRITPATMAAFSSFPDVFKFFQTVLIGEVTDQFTKILGKKPKSGVDQFRFRRHVLYCTMNEWEYLIGFWMPESSEDFPKLAVHFYVTPYPSVQKCADLARVYKQIEIDSAERQFSWKGFHLDQPRSWPYIELSCSFSEILQEEDHVATLRQRLLAYLGETKRVLEQYPYILLGSTVISSVDENQTISQ
jgi:hypothetical protein